MISKVAIYRRWRGPVPKDRDGTPIPRNLWPRRRDCVFLVRWFAPGHDGRIRRPSKRFNTREEAEAFRDKLQTQFKDAPATRRAQEKVTVGFFVTEFLRLRTGPRGQRLKPKSVEAARYVLNSFADFIGRDRRLDAITTADATRYFAHLRSKKLSVSSVNHAKRHLKAAFNVAIKQLDYIKENPFAGFRCDRAPEGTIRYVTPQEFAAILFAAGETEQPAWWKGFLAVMYTGGLRYGEVVHLCWRDIDFAKDIIRVSAKPDGEDTVEWSPKDYESREIPVPPETMTLLAAIQAEAPEGHAYIFLSAERLAAIKAGKEAGTWPECRNPLNNFPRGFRRIVKLAGATERTLVDGKGRAVVSPHDLRRSAITAWSRRVSIQTVMRLAGHSSVTTTQRFYLATTEDELERSRAAAGEAMRVAMGTQPQKAKTPGTEGDQDGRAGEAA